ncbi:MAG: ORF6N domain-containing protein [Bacteroidia bacterium]
MDKLILKETLIATQIHFIRGEQVMLDFDLAMLYGVETKTLKRAVKRNIERFPEDFMFELTKLEWNSLRYQFGTLKRGEHPKYHPYAFTEQGVAMLSGILKSERAVEVNIAIMRTFVQLRKLMSSNKELARKINDLEKKYDEQFHVIFDAIKRLIAEENKPRPVVGFNK